MFSGDTEEIYQSIDPKEWATMFVDPITWWKEITVPVLSLSGADDMNVPTKLSNSLIEQALIAAGNSNYSLYLFPNAGHGLSLENLPKEDWPRMAYGYVPIMKGWFKEMAKQTYNTKK